MPFWKPLSPQITAALNYFLNYPRNLENVHTVINRCTCGPAFMQIKYIFEILCLAVKLATHQDLWICPKSIILIVHSMHYIAIITAFLAFNIYIYLTRYTIYVQWTHFYVKGTGVRAWALWHVALSCWKQPSKYIVKKDGHGQQQ